MIRCLAFALCALVLLATAGCPRPAAAPATPPGPAVAAPAQAQGPDAWFPLRVGERAIRVQVVVTQPEQQKGLMHRTELAPDDGMIFVNQQGDARTFWMMNTPRPLDIGYFDEQGVLREIYPMYPFNTNNVSSRGRDIRYAVEMNQGWYERHGVRPGAQLDLAALRTALAARGFDPALYTPPASQ